MAVELLGMIHARAGITRPTDPDDPDDPTPAPEHFRPTLISFDKDDYAPGETMTATVTGAPSSPTSFDRQVVGEGVGLDGAMGRGAPQGQPARMTPGGHPSNGHHPPGWACHRRDHHRGIPRRPQPHSRNGANRQ